MNKENRYLFAATLLTILIFSVAIYVAVKLPRINLIGGFPPEKVIEFEGTHLAGWKEGQKQWEIYAEAIWYTKDQSITTFEKVSEGTLFKRGRAVIKNLKARQIKYNKWTEEIEGFASVPGKTGEAASLQTLVDVDNIGSNEGRSFKNPRFVFLSAGHLLYGTKTGKSEATGNVRIVEKDLNIFANKMEIAGNSDTAEILGNVLIKKKDTSIKASKMRANFRLDRYSFSGNVELAQKDKVALCELATLENKSGDMELSGKVRFLIEKATAVIKEGTAKALRNSETRKSLKEKTVITCDRLILSTKSKDAQAFGRVDITQKEKHAKSDLATYDGKSEEIVMTGNVFFEKEGEWLKTQKVLISVSGEAFEAVGQVEAEFKIKK